MLPRVDRGTRNGELLPKGPSNRATIFSTFPHILSRPSDPWKFLDTWDRYPIDENALEG